MYNRIIINGRACAGKDTIADFLVNQYGYTKVSFATPIYDIAHNLFKMTLKDRKLLQGIGQKMREVEPDVFVKWAMVEAYKYDKVVIADCRQANEYLTAVAHDFTPVRVKAHLKLRILRSVARDGLEPDITLWENESEIGADNFEYTEIDNNKTLSELYSQVASKLQLYTN